MTVVITTNSSLLIRVLSKRIAIAGRCRCCHRELSLWRIVKKDRFCCWDHRTRWRVNQLIRILGLAEASN